MEENKYSAQLRQLKERFGFEFVSLAMVLEAGRPLLTWVYATGNMNTRYRRIMLEPGKGIAGEVYKTGRALIIQNGHAELPEKERVKYPIMLAEGLVSVLAFPMWREERVQGVLLLAFREANLITEDLIDEVAAYITPSFCDYDVHPTTYDQVIRVGEESEIEAVPVYDLVNYQILRAQEEERRRIARDLHDSVVQELIGIQMLLRSIKYQPDLKSVLDLVDQADTRMNQIQNELRSIATSLRPVSLDDLGLVASFRSFFVRIKESHDVTVSFIENIKEKRFAREQEIVFYRVCQEAVLNACKYSGCSDIEVSLFTSQGYLSLAVTDQGVGFDPDKVEIKGTGMGLLGMADRAELIDGEFSFQSAPGRGTSIWLTAPIKKEEEPS